MDVTFFKFIKNLENNVFEYEVCMFMEIHTICRGLFGFNEKCIFIFLFFWGMGEPLVDY